MTEIGGSGGKVRGQDGRETPLHFHPADWLHDGDRGVGEMERESRGEISLHPADW